MSRIPKTQANSLVSILMFSYLLCFAAWPADTPTSGQAELKQMITDAKKSQATNVRNAANFERWRAKIIKRLNDLFPGQNAGNRFNDATEDRGLIAQNKDTPRRRFASGLGYLEGLTLLDGFTKSPTLSEIQAQLVRFLNEAESNSALRNDDNEFCFWGNRIEAYLQYGINQQTYVQFGIAMSDSGGATVAEKLARTMGVLDFLIERNSKSTKSSTTSTNVVVGDKEITHWIKEAETQEKLATDEFTYERWRSRIKTKLDKDFGVVAANRFSNASHEDYGEHRSTPAVKLSKALGYLEALVLVSQTNGGAVSEQLEAFVKECDAQPAIRQDEEAFARWRLKVETYLETKISPQRAAEFDRATYKYSDRTLPQRAAGGLGVLGPRPVVSAQTTDSKPVDVPKTKKPEGDPDYEFSKATMKRIVSNGHEPLSVFTKKKNEGAVPGGAILVNADGAVQNKDSYILFTTGAQLSPGGKFGPAKSGYVFFNIGDFPIKVGDFVLKKGEAVLYNGEKLEPFILP